jgi:hypothetical protein
LGLVGDAGIGRSDMVVDDLDETVRSEHSTTTIGLLVDEEA